MKATGIVRRIDDLGRVVIPKEIRRTLHIKESDPLEIFTDRDGAVIFKKYSPMGELRDFAVQICESLYKTTGTPAAICDRDTVIAVSGGSRRELQEKAVSPELEEILDGRKFYQQSPGSVSMPVLAGEENYGVSVAAPILSEGETGADRGAVSGKANGKLKKCSVCLTGEQTLHFYGFD